eukprot:IDg15223t1
MVKLNYQPKARSHCPSYRQPSKVNLANFRGQYSRRAWMLNPSMCTGPEKTPSLRLLHCIMSDLALSVYINKSEHGKIAGIENVAWIHGNFPSFHWPEFEIFRLARKDELKGAEIKMTDESYEDDK